jgi:acetyl-CoA synthetase
MARAGQADPIQALLKEGRRFAPSKDFVRKAQVKSASLYKEAGRDPVRFWEK